MPRSPAPQAPAQARPTQARSSRLAWLLLVPLLLAVVAYARVLPGEFVLDDARMLDRARADRGLGAYLGDPFLQAFVHGGRPVSDAVLALGYTLGGQDPRPYHALAIAIHLVAVLLAFLLCRAVLRLAGAARADATALVAAGLFALHPLQTQAVSYVAQLAETLSSALYVGTVLLLLLADRQARRGRWMAALGAALLLFTLSLGAKAIGATAPLAYLLIAWLVPGTRVQAPTVSWRRRLAGLLPFAVVDLWFALRTVASLEGHADAGFSVPGLSPFTYLLTQWRVLSTYLRLVLWPSGQNGDWDVVPSPSLLDPSTLGAGLLLAALLASALVLALRARNRDGSGPAAERVAGAGVAWFFLLLAPTSTVIPIADLMVEHRLYLALLGPFLAVSVGGERGVALLQTRVGARRGAVVAIAAVAAVWMALAVASWRRNAVWESRLAFWADVVEGSPGKSRAHLGYGYALRDRGRLDEAVAQYRQALELAGTNPASRVQILRNLGAALIHAGRLDEAESALLEASRIDPPDADVLVNLGVLAQRREDVPGMERWARAALQVNPGMADAHQVLGVAMVAHGDLPAAVSEFEQAARLDPDDGFKAFNLGLALAQSGRMPEACASWKRALEVRTGPRLLPRVTDAIARAGCR